MRLLVVSDIHDAFDKLRRLDSIERDLTVAVGDFTYSSDLGAVRKALRILNEQGPTIYVPGNTDPPGSEGIRMERVEPIHGRVVEVGGYRFAGLGGSPPTPFNTPLEFSEEELWAVLQRFRGLQNLVLVSHSPPRGALDRTLTGLHVGSTAVRRFIEEERPVAGLHGHIHEARGVERLGPTLLVNPGPLMKGYYAVVRLGSTAEAQLLEL